MYRRQLGMRQACSACADACLGEDMVADLAACIRTDLDCADICQTTGTIINRQTATNTGIVRSLLEAAGPPAGSAPKNANITPGCTTTLRRGLAPPL